MASIGHIAVGMVAARANDRGDRRPALASLALWSAVSLLPDVDVIGFSFGVEYGDPWGHRGATHSLTLAVLLGLAAAGAARALRRPARRIGILTTAVLASHALLDTMTDGGLGCALLWPFDLTRYFAPWRPIPVAPIGAAFFNAGGASVAGVELILFAPLFVLALWPRRRAAPRVATAWLLTLWAGLTWLLVSSDPVRERAVGMIVREDTAYSRGYSEQAFRAIVRGDTQADVLRLLGAPLGQYWFYSPPDRTSQSAIEVAAAAFPDQCVTAIFEDGALTSAQAPEPCAQRGVVRGMSTQQVERVLGMPSESCWSYTGSPGGRRHRVRLICFARGNVQTIIRQWN